MSLNESSEVAKMVTDRYSVEKLKNMKNVCTKIRNRVHHREVHEKLAQIKEFA